MSGDRYTGPLGFSNHSLHRVAIVSGGFDPLHSGHIALLNGAADISDILVVALNSDKWLWRKKGKSFLPWDERREILRHLKMVTNVISFDDVDGTARHAIHKAKEMYPHSHIIFCNGGDRNKGNVPERSLFDDVEYLYGIGGDFKKNSSSWIIDKYMQSKEERVWGYYRVLMARDNVIVKELKIFPGKGMSLQRHFKREEFWWVFDGKCKVRYNFLDDLINRGIYDSNDSEQTKELVKFDRFHIPVEGIHQIYNPYESPCRIIEFQYGEDPDEDDIERFEYYGPI